jgi:hypothetical protein
MVIDRPIHPFPDESIDRSIDDSPHGVAVERMHALQVDVWGQQKNYADLANVGDEEQQKILR